MSKIQSFLLSNLLSAAVLGVLLSPAANATSTHLTGDPVVDGFKFEGNLWDLGKWALDRGPLFGSGLNMAVYTKVFKLTADDTVTAQYGDLGNISGQLVGVCGSSPVAPCDSTDPNDVWAVGDRILAIGYVPITPFSGSQNWGFTFAFKSNGLSNEAVPWMANSASRDESSFMNGWVDGNASGSGTGPGDLRTVQHNQTAQVYSVGSGNVLFKNSTNGDSSGAGTERAIVSIANSNNCSPPDQCQGFNELTNGQLLINLSVIERQDTGDRNTSPQPFADVIDFTVTWGDQDTLNPATQAVFKGISTVVPVSRLGVFTSGFWFQDRNGDFGFDPATEFVGWGNVGDTPVRADWNGDGIDDLSVFSGGTWYLDLNGDRAFDPLTEIKNWGVAGWFPMVGDWNGDGVTNLGVVEPSTMSWFLDLNGDFVFDPDTEVFAWGSPGDTPVVGDWNGDGRDNLGVFSSGLWFIDINGDGIFDAGTEIKGWGVSGWIPVVGDWNGDGKDNIGAIDPSTMAWFRDLNGDFQFDPNTEIVGWGSPGNIPVMGDWNGDGRDKVGAFADGIWFIDLDGDQIFDPATDLKGWGVAGWTPIPGKWQ
jgi:hypothetical protein